MNKFAFNMVSCHFQRMFDKRAPYLITLGIDSSFFIHIWQTMPQTRAVMDDFGTLVIVEDWI